MCANIFAAVVGIEDNEQVTSHALHTFMRHLRKKWPEMVIRDRFSTGTHASLHTAPIFKLWFTLPERVPCPIRWIVSQWTSSYFLQWKNDPGRPQEDLGKGSSGPSTKTTSGSDLRYAKRAFISAVPMLKKKFENKFLFLKLSCIFYCRFDFPTPRTITVCTLHFSHVTIPLTQLQVQ